jgi:hypothetical protein
MTLRRELRPEPLLKSPMEYMRDKDSFTHAHEISKEFGAIGLLIYSQIRNLEYFDIEKEMILINQIDESDSSSLYSKMKSIS